MHTVAVGVVRTLSARGAAPRAARKRCANLEPGAGRTGWTSACYLRCASYTDRVALLRRRLAQFGLGLAAAFLVGCGEGAAEDPGSASGGTAGSGGAAGGTPGGGGTAGDSSVASCPEFSPPPRVTACRAFLGSGGQPNVQDLVFNGPVVTTSSPSTSPTCHQTYDSRGRGVAPPGSFEFQIADETGSLWNFSVYIPDLQNPLANGDVISVASSVVPGSYVGPDIVNLTARDAKGSLLFFVGDGHYPDDLTMPNGLTFTLGDAICAGESSCGSWSHYPFVVLGSSSSVSVPYLGSATLDGFRLTHAGGEVQTSSGIKCWDWAVAHVALAITPMD